MKGEPQNPFTFPHEALANVRDFASYGGRNYADHNRDNPQLFNAYELPWKLVDGPPIVHGLEARLLTVDTTGGATTLMARIPPGWRYTESADEATVELFVAEGDVSVNGDRAGAGGFIAIPKDCGPGELFSAAGAQIFVWWTPDWPADYYYNSKVYVTNVVNEPWIVSEMPGVSHGIMHKALRVPDPCEGVFHGGPAGSLRLILLTPGFGEPRQERHHNTYEEMGLSQRRLLHARAWLHGARHALHEPAGPQARRPDHAARVIDVGSLGYADQRGVRGLPRGTRDQRPLPRDALVHRAAVDGAVARDGRVPGLGRACRAGEGVCQVTARAVPYRLTSA